MLQILLGWIRIRIEKNSSCYFCLYQLSCHCKTLLSPFVRTKLSCHVRCSCYFCLYQLSCHVRLSCHLLSKRNCHVISSCHFVSGLTVVSLSDSRVTFCQDQTVLSCQMVLSLFIRTDCDCAVMSDAPVTFIRTDCDCPVMSDAPVTFYQDWLWLRCHVRCSCHFLSGLTVTALSYKMLLSLFSGLTVTALSCQMLLSLFIRIDCDCPVMSDAHVTFWQLIPVVEWWFRAENLWFWSGPRAGRGGAETKVRIWTNHC